MILYFALALLAIESKPRASGDDPAANTGLGMVGS